MNTRTRDKKQRASRLLAGNRLQEAKDLFEQVCRVDRQDAEAWIALAQINAQLGDPAAVEHCCRTILSIHPNSHDAHFHLGTALLLQGKREEAIESLQRTLQLQPGHAAATLQLGKALHLLTRFDEALAYYREALKLTPKLADAHDSIGSILKYRGDLDGAVESYRMALRINPHADKAHSDLVFVLNYSPRYDAATIYREHVRWGQAHALLPVVPSNFPNNPEPTRKLRIGYVSPDFCKHSVAFFFEPLLAHHDTDKFETFCYSSVAQPDATTQRLQTAATHWRTVTGADDKQLVRQIRQDTIDILVDLTGHTANSRLLAFTARPAPVQVSYLGYPNTTGVPSIDYRLTDAWADPPGLTDDYYIETLVRLPQGFLCYRPADDTPLIARPPGRERSYTTFGSFNNLAKITPEVVSLWASILRAVPDARLVIKNISLRDTATQERLYALFAVHKVAAKRLDLLAPVYHQAGHLELYNQIDIALDTFPYNGTTTTCEALWMGVPVITLAGQMHAGRVGVSLLSQVGAVDLIADSCQDYVRLAVALASDPERLAKLHATLRERMEQSSLCDGKAFANNVEQAYRGMWSKWCVAANAA
ncbi:MAG: tetratricopeptide repeat protein [Gammaproteobacteria bacterium]